MDEIYLKGLEEKLAISLRPIKPRVEFIHSLGQRMKGIKKTILTARMNTGSFFLMVLAGLLSLGVILALLGGWLFKFLGVRK